MAKKSKRSKRYTRKKHYTPHKTIPNRRLRLSKPYKPTYYHEAIKPPIRKARTLPALAVAKTRPKKKPQPKHLAIKHLTQDPISKTLHCVKRAIRKEIMHANNKAGRSGQKRPKWTEDSRKRC